MSERERLSADCMDLAHEECGHWAALGTRLIGKKRGPGVWLCRCDCHIACPLAHDEFATDDDWKALCTCPGTDELKSIQQRTEHGQDERRAVLNEAMADATAGGHRSADELQTDLIAAYDGRGIERHGDLRGTAELLSAVTARRGTRLLRTSGAAVRSLRRLHRAGKNVSFPGPQLQPEVDAIGHTMKKMLRSTATCGTIAAAFAVGARRASGWASVLFAVFAALFSLLTAWMLLWYGLVTLLNMAEKASRTSHE
jgi:hypothetical protein